MSKKQPVKKTTPSITEEQLADLRALLPHVFTEGKVDFDKLHAALGDFGNESPERYSFSWAGKRDAVRILQTPSRATLIPARKESIDFDKTQNIFIEGDNLEVLKLLYKPYFGQVKMIYIDPPYNTGNDFVYPDNFADPLDTYLKITGQKDSQGNLLTSNAETSGRYHSAWLSMMYPRLFLARQLLRDDGVIFVSIDDNEAYNLRSLMNEIFGEENFVEAFIWRSRLGKGSTSKGTARLHEYIMCYSKNLKSIRFLADLRVSENEKKERIRQWGQGDKREDRPTMYYPVISEEFGEIYPKKPDGIDGRWRMRKSEFEKLQREGLVIFEKQDDGRIEAYRMIPEGTETATAQDSILDSKKVKTTAHGSKELSELFDERSFDYPKPTTLIKHFLEIIDDKEALTIDFFAGSATTAQAVLELNREDGGNRKFILVQLPEPIASSVTAIHESPLQTYATIAEIGKERIRRVIKKMKKEREVREVHELPLPPLDKPEDLGFKVFKLRESNYKQWDSSETKDPRAYAKQMEMLADPLVKGWKEEDVIYEVALKEGYGLNVHVTSLSVTALHELPLRKVTDLDKGQSFYICLADKIKMKDFKSLNLKKDDLFICRDIALDDEIAANLSLQCRLKTI